jgi:hypothetical protein
MHFFIPGRLSRTLLLLLSLSGVVILTIPATATTVSGRAALWSYLRDDSVSHLQLVPLLSLNVRAIAHSAWSAETTLRGFTDFQNGQSTGEKLRIQRALLLYKPRTSPWQARIGEQWLTEGIGRGQLAGLSVIYQAQKRTDVTAYGGWRLPNAISLDQAVPNEGTAFGFNLRRKFRRHQLGVSYFHVLKDAVTLYQGAGLDGSLKPSTALSLRGRLHLNLEQSSVETAELTSFWQARRNLSISGSLRNSAPRIFEDSFLAVFLEEAATAAARAAAHWNFHRTLSLTGSATTVFTVDELLYKARIGLGIPQLEVGYTHWLSAGEGDMDGFYAQALLRTRQAFDFNAGFDYSRGSNSEIRPNTESQVEWLGLSWSPRRAFQCGARIEHLKDPAHSEDWRALLSVSSQFLFTSGEVKP